MKFIKIDSTQPITDYLYGTLLEKLATGRKVLWLVPGGSAIPIVQDVMSQLRSDAVSNLAIGLTDERFGEVGHTDENWHAIMGSNPLLTKAALVPVNSGKNMQQTTKDYAAKLEQLLNWADYTVGFFGMGVDGHTAGILPNSSAVHAKELVTSYDAGVFKRITISPRLIAMLDIAVLYAVGPEKHTVLQELTVKHTIIAMPAQALKAAGDLVVFNDYMGDVI